MPADPRDYRLELSNLPADPAPSDPAPAPNDPALSGRAFLSVLFACCNVYQRIYRSRDEARYEGGCPRCGKRVRFVVGQDGTPYRIFRAM